MFVKHSLMDFSNIAQSTTSKLTEFRSPTSKASEWYWNTIREAFHISHPTLISSPPCSCTRQPLPPIWGRAKPAYRNGLHFYTDSEYRAVCLGARCWRGLRDSESQSRAVHHRWWQGKPPRKSVVWWFVNRWPVDCKQTICDWSRITLEMGLWDCNKWLGVTIGLCLDRRALIQTRKWVSST